MNSQTQGLLLPGNYSYSFCKLCSFTFSVFYTLANLIATLVRIHSKIIRNKFTVKSQSHADSAAIQLRISSWLPDWTILDPNSKNLDIF